MIGWAIAEVPPSLGAPIAGAELFSSVFPCITEYILLQQSLVVDYHIEFGMALRHTISNNQSS